MKSILLGMAALLLSATAGFAQTDSLYLNDNFNRTSKDKAIYYRVTQATDAKTGSGTHKYFYLTGQKYQERPYRKLDSVLHGTSSTWHKNGKLKSRTQYVNGLAQGKSEEWFENGDLQRIVHYVDGKLEGERKTYHANKQLKRRDVFAKGELLEGKCYDPQGAEVSYYPYETAPNYPGNLSANLSRLIQSYVSFETSMTDEEGGEVLLGFIVNKEGVMEDIIIVKSTNAYLAEAGIKALSSLTGWQPGTRDGEPASFYLQIPYKIRFR
jgi:hypothetical protein